MTRAEFLTHLRAICSEIGPAHRATFDSIEFIAMHQPERIDIALSRLGLAFEEPSVMVGSAERK